MSTTYPRWIAGCMTGTSLDGIDVALVRIDGRGLDMTAKFQGLVSKPLGPLADTLRRLAQGNPEPPIEFMRAARALGELHADAIEELSRTFGKRVPARALSSRFAVRAAVDFVVAHGQTIWHAPCRKADAHNGEAAAKPAVTWTGAAAEPRAAHPQAATRDPLSLSWQLFDPWPIVYRLGAVVCYDLRQADLIAGGQGAPVTPLADWIMYRDVERPCAVVNLGGICNVTLLREQAEDTRGRDVGPCNILLDTVVQRLFPGKSCDTDGAIARTGRVVPMLHRAIVIDVLDILENQRSLGREQFPLSVIDGWLATAKKYEKPQDIVASYTMAVADLVGIGIASVVKDTGAKQIILAGGGARNPVLVEHIAAHDMLSTFGAKVIRSDDVGIPCEAREAMAFAVLGALSQDSVPITLPEITGARGPGRAGAWVYPDHNDVRE